MNTDEDGQRVSGDPETAYENAQAEQAYDRQQESWSGTPGIDPSRAYDGPEADLRAVVQWNNEGVTKILLPCCSVAKVYGAFGGARLESFRHSMTPPHASAGQLLSRAEIAAVRVSLAEAFADWKRDRS